MHSAGHQPKGIERRRLLGDLLIAGGVLLLFGVALAMLKTVLATSQLSEYHFLSSKVAFRMPLPTPPAPAVVEVSPPMLYIPLIANPDPAELEAIQKVELEVPVGARPGPSAGPIVRLVIPALKVDRTVVTVGIKRGANNQLEWNTDSLFSTSNRSDLVGQIEASSNPGDGGNIVLMGHNYNNGWYANAGVFVNLQNLQPGSQITVYTQDGGQHQYTVQQVKKIPWQKQNAAELEKHQKYLWPTEHEQLTLVTCGGANLLSWSARIYVVATPSDSTASN